MLALPAPSATFQGVNPHFNPRRPLRVRALAPKKSQTSADSTSTCGFRPRQRHSQTVCTSSASDNAGNIPQQGKLKSKLEKAALFSFAPLAAALPVCFGYGGHDGNGNGDGGSNGDGSGGSGHGDDSSPNVIADIAEEEDDDDDDEEQDDEEGNEEDEEVGCILHGPDSINLAFSHIHSISCSHIASITPCLHPPVSRSLCTHCTFLSDPYTGCHIDVSYKASVLQVIAGG